MKVILLMLAASLLAMADGRELSGKVLDADTGQPIARVHVTVRFFQGPQPAPEVVLLTDSDGVFKMTNMPESGFQITCEKAGYLTANPGAGAAVNNGGSKTAANMIVKMTAQAALEGTVVDDQDIPAADTFIQLVRQRVMNGRRQLEIAQGGGTDETGAFRLFDLPAGRYYLSIIPRLTGARRAKAVAYPQLYYPMALDIPTAQPIDLKAGDDLQLKIQLPQPIPAFQVSGVVATGAPDVSVILVSQQASQMVQQPVGEVNLDAKTKTFRISHVPPGLYQLRANAQDGKNYLQASTTVSVGGSDVAGIRLDPANIALDGTMRMDGDTPKAQPGGMGFISLQSTRSGGGGQVDAEGKFHIANLQPDTYRVVPQAYGQQCVRSILQGGQDVRDNLTIAPGVAPAPIEVLMSTHCGTVNVALSPSDASTQPGLAAYLLRKNGEAFEFEKQAMPTATDTDGTRHFSIRGVASGDYMVFVWTQDAPVEYTDADFMRTLQSYGQAISVTDESTVTVTVDKVLTLR